MIINGETVSGTSVLTKGTCYFGIIWWNLESLCLWEWFGILLFLFLHGNDLSLLCFMEMPPLHLKTQTLGGWTVRSNPRRFPIPWYSPTPRHPQITLEKQTLLSKYFLDHICISICIWFIILNSLSISQHQTVAARSLSISANVHTVSHLPRLAKGDPKPLLPDATSPVLSHPDNNIHFFTVWAPALNFVLRLFHLCCQDERWRSNIHYSPAWDCSKPGLVTKACNSSIREAEAGGSL